MLNLRKVSIVEESEIRPKTLLKLSAFANLKCPSYVSVFAFLYILERR